MKASVFYCSGRECVCVCVCVCVSVCVYVYVRVGGGSGLATTRPCRVGSSSFEAVMSQGAPAFAFVRKARCRGDPPGTDESCMLQRRGGERLVPVAASRLPIQVSISVVDRALQS